MKEAVAPVNKRNVIKPAASDRVFAAIVGVILVLLTMIVLYPLLYVLSASFSSANAVSTGKVVLWPVDFSLEGYQRVFDYSRVWIGYRNTLAYTLVGTAVNIAMTMMCAYPLPLLVLFNDTVVTGICTFTMIFGGGLIPTYLVVSRTGLLNSLWALVLPGAVQVMNVVLMQNFIKSLPYDISEAAFVDGAGHWRTMCQIILPLCKPSIAAISLFVMVGHWNEWFAGTIYMNNSKLYPLQSFLQTQITDFNQAEISQAVLEAQAERAAQASNRAAQMFLAMIPILCVYPFLQKHFTKGIVMGSVKG